MPSGWGSWPCWTCFGWRSPAGAPGLGACLLAQLEQDAARQGAKRLELNTFGFQAPGFYEKLGYRRFGAVEPAVGEYGHYFYVKEL